MMHWAIAAALAAAMFVPGPGLPDRAQVMAVPAELQARLRDQVLRKSQSKEQRLRLLVDFMSGDPHGLMLEYDATATRTLEDTVRSGKANCLSFTLLFVTLARTAGLEAHVQEMDQALVWYRQEGTVYGASHVNARVRAGGPWQTVDVGGNTVLGRKPPQRISDQRALAYFYNNRGAELMASGERVAARQHLDAALVLDPGNAAAWNNLGVLHMRNEDRRGAEQAYDTALEHDPAHAASLTNLVSLYQRSGDTQRAANYLRRLQEVQLADPFHQFLLAVEQEELGNHANAADYYRRAIRLHADEHMFHFNLARTYLLMGDSRRARRALARAYALSDEVTRRDYQAKVEDLRRPAKALHVPSP